MKRLFLKKIACLLLLSAVLVSCKKSSVKTKTELLTQGTWKFKSATVGGSDWSSNIQACQKDNVYTFVSNGTGSADEGPAKCNTGDPQTIPFTWNFQSAETILFISTTLFTGGSSTFNLVLISETELVVSQGITGPGPTFLVIVTFMH